MKDIEFDKTNQVANTSGKVYSSTYQLEPNYLCQPLYKQLQYTTLQLHTFVTLKAVNREDKRSRR